MKEQLRINNEDPKIAMVLLALFIILITVVIVVKRYDLDNVERVNIADRIREPMVQNYDGCTYIRFVHTDEYIHQANCPNPDHKTEGK